MPVFFKKNGGLTHLNDGEGAAPVRPIESPPVTVSPAPFGLRFIASRLNGPGPVPSRVPDPICKISEGSP